MAICPNCGKEKTAVYTSCPSCDPGADKTVLENERPGHSALEPGFAPTIVEEEAPDKTVLEDFAGRTRIDTAADAVFKPAPAGELPPFFAWIVFIDEEGLPVYNTRLKKEKNIIGSDEQAAVRVSADFVSRLHALLYFDEEDFYISDLGSTNGTFLNGRQVKKEVLLDGDSLRIGRQEMIFKQVKRSL
ncbi:MAG: FHA domain-containing protein [Candidatus Aminicenantes bacterium]|nr:FHA domain-containing protein [Candidatus Aminicenantes bacterium]